MSEPRVETSLKRHRYPSEVQLVEVGMRDGLQNEPQLLSTEEKLGWIKEMIDCGIKRIEVGSFVNPKQVPQMANTPDLFKALSQICEVSNHSSLQFSALVANQAGLELAQEYGAKYLALFTAASPVFCQKNIHCSIEQSLKRFALMIDRIEKGVVRHIRAYISCAWDCPFSGPINNSSVIVVAKALEDMGCHEIVLADTSGKASPDQVERLISKCLDSLERAKLAVHFHNTYGLAQVNTLVALQQGISRIDASIAGLGGCPSAPNAGGNLVTEDFLFLLNQMGIKNGVNMTKIVSLGKKIEKRLQRSHLAHLN